jgi:hypothetical protein
MTNRIRAILIALAVLCGTSAFCQSDWTGIDYYPGYNFFPVETQSGDVCSFAFPDASSHAHYPAFLVQTNAACFSLSNRILTLTFLLECSTNAVFRFGGEGSWNTGGFPANTRIFFSTVTGYDNEGAGTNYWFNSTWVELSTNTGTASLSVTLTNAASWSDGQGGSDSNAFWRASSNVLEVGVCFGGGSFFDVGDAMISGAAVFHLKSFSIVPPQFRIYIDGDQLTIRGNVNLDFMIEHSDDMVLWLDYGSARLDEPVTVEKSGFYRAKLL